MLELGGRNVAYGYDEDYRLKSETITASPGGKNGVVSYVYDPVGNRASMTSTLAAVPGGQFFYDNNDRLTTDVYDNNGNTTSSAGIANTYTFENQMKSHGAVTIVYDGDGNRVSETAGGTTTKYLVDDLNPTGLPQVLDEIVSGSVTRTYAYGLQRISQNQKIKSKWTPSYYGYDGHGNVRILTSTTGASTDTLQFDAFGMPIAITGTTPNNFQYSGEWFDSSVGLYHLRARHYNQTTGRFWSRDPEEGELCCGLSLNPYVYAHQDPGNRLDPTGRADIMERVAEGLDKWNTFVDPGISGNSLGDCISDSFLSEAIALEVLTNGTPNARASGAQASGSELRRCILKETKDMTWGTIWGNVPERYRPF